MIVLFALKVAWRASAHASVILSLLGGEYVIWRPPGGERLSPPNDTTAGDLHERRDCDRPSAEAQDRGACAHSLHHGLPREVWRWADKRGGCRDDPRPGCRGGRAMGGQLW